MLQNVSGQTLFFAFQKYEASKEDPKNIRPTITREEICINAGEMIMDGANLKKLKTHPLWDRVENDPKVFKRIG